MLFLVIRDFSSKRPIGTAALIRGRRILTFWFQIRCLFEGGAYSGAALIRVNTVLGKEVNTRANIRSKRC